MSTGDERGGKQGMKGFSSIEVILINVDVATYLSSYIMISRVWGLSQLKGRS